jgi:hypothetical protein
MSTTSTSQYAFQGAGTFSGGREFTTIAFLDSSNVSIFDTTGAVTLLYDVAAFNALIGIIKDASNVNITSTANYYDASNDKLTNDSIVLSASQLVTGLNNQTSNVFSVGKLSTIYSDFAEYVAVYFGMPISPNSATSTVTQYGFANLFSNDYNFNPNNGVFQQQQLLDITTVTSTTNQSVLITDPSYVPIGTGGFINNLNGSITLSNITAILRNAVFNNQFNNRSTATGTTASDPKDRANYGVSDGFFDGDLLFIPNNGFQITLDLGIKSTTFPITKGSVYDASYGLATDASYNANTKSSTNLGVDGKTSFTTASNFTSVSTATSTLLSRVVTAPLLIRLTNLTLPYVSLLSATYTIYANVIALSIRGKFDKVTINVYNTSATSTAVSLATLSPITSLTTVVDQFNQTSYSFNDTTILAIGTNNFYTVTPYLAGAIGNISSFIPVFLPTNPINWYKCDVADISGSTLLDYMNSSYDGTLFSAQSSTNAKYGSGALQFNGTTSYFLSKALTTVATTGKGLSYSLWFNGSTGTIFSFLTLFFSTTTTNLTINTGAKSYTSAWAPVANQYNHLAVICAYNASGGGDWNIYLNNVLVYSIPTIEFVSVGTAQTTFGARTVSGVQSAYFNGLMDSIRVFDRPLTALDVSFLYSKALN